MRTMFYHGVTTDNRRFTVSGTPSKDFMTLKLGVAICGEKELFCRKTGRIKSESRLLGSAKHGVLTKLSIDKKEEYHKEFVNICSEFNRISSKDLKKIFHLYNCKTKKKINDNKS
jgi:hypothetical protein